MDLIFFSLFQEYGKGKGGSLGFTGLIALDGVYGGVHGWTIPWVFTRQMAPSYKMLPLRIRR